MLVQTPTDEEKLNSVRQNVQKRPAPNPSSQRNPQYKSSTFPRDISSDDGDSLNDQSTNYSGRTSTPSTVMNTNHQYREKYPSIPESIDSISTRQTASDQIPSEHKNKDSADCASVTSSEWGVDSERGEGILQQHNTTVKCMLQIS
jgi:hypothetical protein